MIEFLSVSIISFLASSVGALLGIGGGVVMVPLFVMFCKLTIQQAVAISLFTIIGTSALVSSKFIKSGALNLKLGISLELFTTGGSIVGGLVALRLNHRLLSALFGLFLIGVAFLMSIKNRKNMEKLAENGSFSYFDDKLNKNVFYTPKNLTAAYPISFAAGLTSGMFGIGGGVLKVPLLFKICKLPIKVATATSSFMVGITASAAAYIYYSNGVLIPQLAFFSMIGSLFGSRVGVLIHSKIDSEKLKQVFIYSLIVIAIFMIFKALK
ncbi:sulfite exporter TauE/SafE family protein [Hippea maritima]|uniref:Probable membrane transporter protein n=1 Tax=Hippea maritima (strain ATCC 700847 / DSM 10411 / MH2) TaxID=760142 RepID=F2LY79_HIPMA|nr:sulfite exporter TauE/SafE family protein [Hippea maritima]AEA34402.1 protein of unknown function DUF81 [Hippea maritima DSM 10411]